MTDVAVVIAAFERARARLGRRVEQTVADPEASAKNAIESIDAAIAEGRQSDPGPDGTPGQTPRASAAD